MQKIRVFIIEDHPMMVEGLLSSLANHPDIEVAGYALQASGALDFIRKHNVEVILSDINLPDGDGIELCRIITKEFPAVKILALTTFNQYNYITEIMKSGAVGYLLKNATKEELVEAICAAHANKKYFSAEVTETLLQSQMNGADKLPKLTRREKEILSLVAAGLTNQEIADNLFISILTVISHRKNLLAKFQVANTAALIRIATKNQLL